MEQYENPRKQVYKLIRKEDLDALLDRAAVLHGHYCPGLALGVKAAFMAVKELDVETEGLQDLLAIVETNNCSTDGIQFITGCTFGNNSLIFRDLGKTAFTLTGRDGKGIRLVTKQDAGEEWSDAYPEYEKLFEKVVKKREGSEEDVERFAVLSKKVSHHVVNLHADRLFKTEYVDVDIPEYAPIHESYTCDICGESVMSTRTIEKDDEILCLECSDSEYDELTGFGIDHRGELGE